MTNAHVIQELAAYLDDALTAEARARVTAHVVQCPACAAALDRQRALRQTLSRDLGATLDAALAPMRLSHEADARIRATLRRRLEQPQWWWALWPRRGLLAQAALALLVLFHAVNFAQMLPPSTAEMPPLAPGEVWVLGQERLAPGRAAAFRVLALGAESAVPLTGAVIAVSLREASGSVHPVYQGRTDRDGSAAVAFTVPAALSGPAELVVEASLYGHTARLAQPLTIARAHKIYLTSDKPAYRPGQTIHLRALALDAADLRPVVAEMLHFALLDAAGRVMANEAVALSEYGVAAATLTAPDAAGLYTLRAALDDTVVERVINVADYDLPPFRVTLELDRPFYAPGDVLRGAVEAASFTGKPAAGARVSVRGYAGPETAAPVIGVGGELDATGYFTFEMPVKALAAPFVLEAEVIQGDVGGPRAGVRRIVPVSLEPLLIQAVLESGDLKPGVPNLLYVMAAYPDGVPAEVTLTAQINGTEQRVTTSPAGLATLTVTPLPGERVNVILTAEDAAGVTVVKPLTFEPGSAPEALLLRAERAVYRVGDTLALEALVSGNLSTVYLDVVHAGQTAALLAAPVEAGRAIFALDLEPALVGALELHAYALLPDGDAIEDTRLVVVDPAQQLAVTVTADQARYRPGETAQVTLAVTQADQPVEAVLGVAVVDASVYALETLPPGFARTYFLLQQEMLARQTRVMDLPPVNEITAAQDLAARAAWAAAAVADFSLRERVPFTALARDLSGEPTRLTGLGATLAALALLVAGMTVRGLAAAGLLARALRRFGWCLLAATVLSPLLIGGGVIGWLIPVMGQLAFFGALALTSSALSGLLLLGWLRRDAQMQVVGGLTAGYLLLGGLALTLAARGGAPGGLGIALMTASFFLLLAALTLWGQGALTLGQPGRGWLVTALAVLLAFLAVTLPAFPALTSGLSRALSAPGLYLGPVGWLSGCGSAPMATQVVEAPGAVVTGEVPAEAAQTPPPPAATPIPAPALELPAEPYPLRAIFPETLYWAPAVQTDAAGRATLAIPLADSLTTWRLTALASTREGVLGAAEYDLLVTQDFFIELTAPQTLKVDTEALMQVTLYNDLALTQTVQLYIDAAWATLGSAPETTWEMGAGSRQIIPVLFRPERVGEFTLRVWAVGAEVGDGVSQTVTVEP